VMNSVTTSLPMVLSRSSGPPGGAGVLVFLAEPADRAGFRGTGAAAGSLWSRTGAAGIDTRQKVSLPGSQGCLDDHPGVRPTACGSFGWWQAAPVRRLAPVRQHGSGGLSPSKSVAASLPGSGFASGRDLGDPLFGDDQVGDRVSD